MPFTMASVSLGFAARKFSIMEAESLVESDDVVVGNVENLLVTPPSHTGRANKGHLVFDAAFESGNLGRVDYVSESEFDLFVRPDTCSPKYRVWFYFRVKNVRKDQRAIFNIVNFSKTKSLYKDGMAPVVKSTSRPKWQRIPPRHVFYYKSPQHDNNLVMSFAFAFDKEEDTYSFAYCYPYTYSRLQDYLSKLEAKRLPHFNRDLVALTVQQRRLDLITITDPTNLSVAGRQRIIFVTARVHPGETPASCAIQGLMDFLLGDSSQAKKLREKFVFKIVPMLNPDGVFLGNYRCSLMGFDLNRHWQTPSAWAQPTIFATKNLLIQYNTNPKIQLDFYIDIHGHTAALNSFFYGNIFTNDMTRCDRQVILPTVLSELSDDFNLDKTEFNMDPIKAGTGRRVIAGSTDIQSMCYTLEISCFGYIPKDNSSLIPYTEEGYAKIGENLGLAFHRWCELEENEEQLQTRPFSSFVTRVLEPIHAKKDANTTKEHSKVVKKTNSD